MMYAFVIVSLLLVVSAAGNLYLMRSINILEDAHSRELRDSIKDASDNGFRVGYDAGADYWKSVGRREV